MRNLTDFALRAHTRSLRLAIQNSYSITIDEAYKSLNKKIKLLGDRMGEVLMESGYKDFSKLEIRMEEPDWGRQMGIGVFLEAEKHDDIRGFLLAVFKEAEELYGINDRLKERNKELIESIETFADEKPITAAKYFPEFVKEDNDERI